MSTERHSRRACGTWTTAAVLLFISTAARAAEVSYTYDALDRVIQVSYGGSARVTYAYDASGNRLSVTSCLDVDGDGYWIGGPGCLPADCEDSDPLINPAALETCNGRDDDCDGLVDSEDPSMEPCNDDANVCTDSICQDGRCGVMNSAPCDDGNACTTADTCAGGTCVGGAAPNCNDGNPCTDDSCSTVTGCVHANNAASCDDGNACTTGDTCSGGTCVGGSALNCNDGNPCSDDTCNTATGCVHTNNTASCDDGNACTQTDTCQAGSCVGATPVTCTASDQCHVAGTCNTANGTCSNPNAGNGTVCDDSDACTTGDACNAGLCQGQPIPGCVCGDGVLGNGETCDDGNTVFNNGEYCGPNCQRVPCGRPTNSTAVAPKASDALFTLRAAVGQTTCDERVCDVDDSGAILASDALRILRAAVGQAVTLDCPASLAAQEFPQATDTTLPPPGSDLPSTTSPSPTSTTEFRPGGAQN